MWHNNLIVLFLKLVIFLFIVRGGNCQIFHLANNIYSDGMVLQMEPKRAHIWGYGTIGARIEIMIDTDVSIVTTFVQDNATWTARLPPQPAGGPHTVFIEHVPLDKSSSKEIAQLRNVTFGDIWVCAGEANMEFPMKNIFNSTQEMETALTYTRLHVMKLAQHFAADELDQVQSVSLPWGPVTAAVVGDFPAICLLYGERLSDALPDRHIGLIAVTWPDTPIEAWVSSYVTDVCQTPPTSGGINQTSNNAIWNGMVRPLARAAVRGVIWSQGESNLRYNLQYYACHLLRLTQTWRNTFADGIVNVTSDGWAFPFGIIQTGPMEFKDDEDVGLLRYHQTIDSEVAPNVYANETFMAPTYDLFDATSPFGSIYFRDKQTVARRLSEAARRLIYNETQLHFVGPIPSVVWDYVTSMMNVTWSWDIRILNKVGESSGFFYQAPTKEWIEAPIEALYEDTLMFWVHPNYTHVAYAWKAVPCDYLQCNVYTDRENGLPHITLMFPPYGDPLP